MTDGFCFHRMGEPPDALLLLLSLLLAPAPPRTGDNSATDTTACRTFAALSTTERHRRAAVAGAEGLGLRILSRAMQVPRLRCIAWCRSGTCIRDVFSPV